MDGEMNGPPEAAVGAPRRRPGPWPGPRIDRATPEQWAELIGWVDWRQARYGVLPEYDIAPCWPTHTSIVEELVGLHHPWKRAQLADQQADTTGSNDVVGWQDRPFWPLRQRAKTATTAPPTAKKDTSRNGSPRNLPTGSTYPRMLSNPTPQPRRGDRRQGHRAGLNRSEDRRLTYPQTPRGRMRR